MEKKIEEGGVFTMRIPGEAPFPSPKPPEFEKRCPQCKGEQSWYCDFCDRTGYVPTDYGDELLAFLRRHGFVQARER